MGVAALLLTLACGCASSQGSHTTTLPAFVPGFTETPGPAVTTLAAVWNPRVISGVDPAHGGAPMAGLAGRVWLFNEDLKENPLANGKLVVELWAQPPGQPQAQPVRMEVWEIKKEILNSVYKRTDSIGPGYSLSLPWPSYRPDIAEVHLRVHYEPEKGGVPVYAQEQVLTLNTGSNGIPVVSRRTELGNGQPVVSGPPGAGPPANATPMPQPGTMPPPGMGPVQQTGAFQPPSFGAAPAAVAVPMPPPGPPVAIPAPAMGPIQQPGAAAFQPQSQVMPWQR